MYRKHRHMFRIARRWNHPRGYLMRCQRCTNEGLYSYRLWRI